MGNDGKERFLFSQNFLELSILENDFLFSQLAGRDVAIAAATPQKPSFLGVDCLAAMPDPTNLPRVGNNAQVCSHMFTFKQHLLVKVETGQALQVFRVDDSQHQARVLHEFSG
jgi:hypothetical protein